MLVAGADRCERGGVSGKVRCGPGLDYIARAGGNCFAREEIAAANDSPTVVLLAINAEPNGAHVNGRHAPARGVERRESGDAPSAFACFRAGCFERLSGARDERQGPDQFSYHALRVT